LLLIFTVYAFISGKTYLFKSVYYNFSNIDDYQIFENNIVKAGTAKPWAFAANYNKINYPDSVNALIEKLQTVGLLVIHNNEISF
ncbi:hypothetical protein ACO1MN_15675, partial [Staphylococcus aureus]